MSLTAIKAGGHEGGDGSAEMEEAFSEDVGEREGAVR